jgi:hypothetical protein
MAAGFGIAALGIGWPALVVGGPLVLGGLAVAAVTYVNGMQQQHARQYRRYAQVAQQQWAAAMPAWDGYGDSARDDRLPWKEYRPLQDEDTLDSEEMAALIAGLPAELGLPRPDPDRAAGNSPADTGSGINGSEVSSPGDSD